MTSDYSGAHNLPEAFRLSPEFRLVTACSWLPATTDATQQNESIAQLSQGGLDWNEVARLVRKHDVAGQFCSVMSKFSWLHVPIETAELLKALRTEQAARALGQVAEMARVGRCFTEAGLTLIPLKGVALSQELYRNPCVRNACDLDILVRPEDVARGEELLVRLGYRHALGFHEMPDRQKRHIIETLHHHEYVNDAIGVCIELHWRSFLWTSEQVAALWSSAVPLPWLNCGLQQLSPETTALFLMDHGARHGWSCLKWLSDVAMLLENLPENKWLSLYEQAAFFDLQRIVLQTVTLLHWFYDIAPPQQLQRLAEADAFVRKTTSQAASLLLASGDTIPFMEKRFPGISTALRLKRLKPATPLPILLRGSLITFDDFSHHSLPDNLFWLYVLMRPYYWFKRRCLKR